MYIIKSRSRQKTKEKKNNLPNKEYYKNTGTRREKCVVIKDKAH